MPQSERMPLGFPRLVMNLRMARSGVSPPHVFGSLLVDLVDDNLGEWVCPG